MGLRLCVGARRAVARALLLACAAALLLLVQAAPAAAHAVLLATSPLDGDQLGTAPTEVTLEFSEPVSGELGSVRVYDSTGEQVDLGDAGVGSEPNRLRVGLRDDLTDDTYVTTWRAISADGHPIRGAFVFAVGDAGPADAGLIAELLEGGDDAGWELAATVNRWLLYTAVLLAAGGLLFLAFVHDRHEAERPVLSRIVVAAAAFAVVASLAGIALQGAVGTGLGAQALVSPDVLRSVVASSFGLAAAVRVVGAVLVGAAAIMLWRQAAVAAGTLGALLAMGSFALTGHTSVSDPRWLAASANFAHTLFAAAWFGGLVLLLVVLRRRRQSSDAVGGGRVVARFSTYATATVVIVVIAGTALGWSEVRELRALFTTAYGWTLIAKLAVVGAVIAAAAYNQRRLVPRISSGGADGTAAWKRLRGVVRFEVLGIAGALLVTAVLSSIVPAKTAAGVVGAFSEYVPLGAEHQVNVTVDPNRAGTNTFHLYLLDARGQPTDTAEQVQLSFAQPANDIGPIEREPTVAGPGHWSLTGPELSIPGRWEVTFTALFDDLEQRSATVAVDVGG